jgi:hypothetical protein
MAPQGATDALRSALSSLNPGDFTASAMHGPLHANVCAVVDELKAIGARPEHVILTIKAIAHESSLGSRRSILIEKMVTWCLAQYFKETPTK